jgi:phosphoribosylanthranilate isomerase
MSITEGLSRNIKGAHFAVGLIVASPPTERSAVVNQAKYIGMDVHQATISVAVMDSAGQLILESILETKAATILQFIGGQNPPSAF